MTDPTRIDPKLGGEPEFDRLCRELESAGMGLLLDIVPNHMAATPESPWFRDVLEKGRRSPYASFFDIDWREEKTFLPILGEPLPEAIEKGRIALEVGEQGLVVRYGETILPVDAASYHELLSHRSDRWEESLGENDHLREDFRRLLDRIEALPPHTETDAPGVAGSRRERIKQRLLELYRTREALRELLDETIREFNDTGQNPSLLQGLLEAQAYRLAFWREAVRRLNYRRFFNISDLIGLRVEDPEVFRASHALILRLVAEGRVAGLRIDHIDGLFDPEEYLRTLREAVAPDASGIYLVVEKILGPGEALPDAWPVCGTTGYEFANAANGVLVDARALESLRARYARWTGSEERFAELVYREKKRIAQTRLAPELRSLVRELEALAGSAGRELPAGSLRRGLVEVTGCLPVYRTYVASLSMSPRDRHFLENALAEARRREGSECGASLDFLGRVLTLDFPEGLSQRDQEAWLAFVMRFQQFTGPVMAKGEEDTASYLYNPLISVNEVGSEGEAMEPGGFHAFAERRAQRWPGSLNATSTHDTKRSEDVRARIDVLSEVAEEWAERFERWSQQNRAQRRRVNGALAPDASEELLLYQTLLGAWPFSEAEVEEFRGRLRRFLVKAVREGKRHSRWTDPDAAYEGALLAFSDALLAPSEENRFLPDFLLFQKRIAFHGAVNSLAQTLLKLVAPGVPDLYQGTELWDLSLVDPDNRRPVDFEKRRAMLGELDRRSEENLRRLLQELRERWQDGGIKLFLLSRTLRYRAAHPDLFARGGYLPLEAVGERGENVLAFARREGSVWAVAAAPRLSTRLTGPDRPFGELSFGETSLLLPAESPRRWHNVLTGEAVEAAKAPLPLSRLFRCFPVALLVAE